MSANLFAHQEAPISRHKLEIIGDLIGCWATGAARGEPSGRASGRALPPGAVSASPSEHSRDGSLHCRARCSLAGLPGQVLVGLPAEVAVHC